MNAPLRLQPVRPDPSQFIARPGAFPIFDILIDFETRAVVDIDVGHWRYWSDPETEILCCGFAIKAPGSEWSAPAMVIFEPGEHGFDAIEAAARQHGFTGDFYTVWDLLDLLHRARRVVAHNFGFERAGVICKFPMLEIPREKWTCTAARSRRLGLPGKLKLVLELLEIGEKDMAGNAVMLQCSKPRPAWKNSGKGRKFFDDANRLGRTAAYCARDIVGECDLDDFLPELDEIETRRWWRIQERNDHGLKIDLVYLHNAIRIIEMHNAEVSERIRLLTNGAIENLASRDQVLDFVKRFGCHMPSLGKDEITKVLERKDLLAPLVVAVLEARQEVTKASTKKLYSIRDRLMGDGTIKDSVIYFGAHTGRDTGSGAQPLNLPRPDDVVALDARDAIKAFDLVKLATCCNEHAGKRTAGTVSGVTTYRGPKFTVGPSEAVAESLRTVFEAEDGYKFVAADYSKQELIATFYIAGQDDAIERVNGKGPDEYCSFAEHVYGRPIDKHNDPNERQLGKQGVLGGGYGLTKAETFIATCAKYGMGLTVEVAQKVVEVYPKKYPMVPKAWAGLYAAAVKAMEHPMRWFEYRGINYRFDGNWLAFVLPNGSWRYYPKARLEPSKYARGRPSITYASTYQGKLVRSSLHGGLCLENVVQPFAREWMEEDAEAIRQELGYYVALTVYDEIVARVPVDDTEAKAKIEAIMSRPKPYAPGLRFGLDLWEGDCYRKG